ncbi:MAG: type II secretion system F family protein [Parachlamydiaceae bacterium]
MPVFHYQALETTGKKIKGFVEAQNEKEAKQKLREQSIMVTKIEVNASLKSSQHLNREQLLTFSSMLAELISAKLPLYESLSTIEEQVRKEPYHRIILSLAEQVKSGSPLSEAMRSFPESFNRLYVSMVLAGEASGNLEEVLNRQVMFLKKEAKIRKQISNALIYPGILSLFAFAVIILLMGFVVPSIEGVFEGRQLNSYTMLVLSLSHIFREWWWLLLIAACGIGFGVYSYLSKPTGKLQLQKWLMKLPLINKVMIQAALIRFSRTLSTLTESGLNLVEGLKLAGQVMQNALMEEEIVRAEKRILEGGRLQDELKKSRYLPKMAVRMIAIGEESGHLGEMLGKVADMYEDDLEKTIDRTMSLIQPAILVIMGAIIGLVLMAILLPMTDISSLTET